MQVPRPRVRKVGDRWTVTRPAYGFGLDRTTRHRSWRAALQSLDERHPAERRLAGSGLCLEVAYQLYQPRGEDIIMAGTKPNTGTPADKRLKENGGRKPGPKPGGKNKR